MDENSGNNKVLGLESGAYVKLCYALVLVSGVLGLILSLLGVVGVGGGGSGLVGLVGLAGMVMALLGWLAFAKDFTVIEQSHLKFLSLLFIGFYIAGLVLASILGGTGAFWYLISFALGAAMVLAVYLGFRLWQARHEVTQPGLKAEFESFKAYAINRSKR